MCQQRGAAEGGRLSGLSRAPAAFLHVALCRRGTQAAGCACLQLRRAMGRWGQVFIFQSLPVPAEK
jgi:hypothetical protein